MQLDFVSSSQQVVRHRRRKLDNVTDCRMITSVWDFTFVPHERNFTKMKVIHRFILNVDGV